MKTVKRLSAIFLAILMLILVMAPGMAFADATDGNGDGGTPPTEGSANDGGSGEGGTTTGGTTGGGDGADGGNTTATPFSYVDVAGTSCPFNKYLVLDSEASVPNVTFTYSIAAGTAIAASSSGFEVLAGVGTPTVNSAAFMVNDSKSTTVASGDTVTLASGKAYAKKTVTVDFRSVSFPEPGVYRYILTENETSGAMGISYDTQKASDATAKTRTLDVYVTDNGSGTLVVSAYVLHNGTDAPALNSTAGTGDVTTAGAALADKSDGFVNEYASLNLTVSKTVSGNQGSKDKYFDFTVTISGAIAGTVYTVDLSDADATSGSNAATIEANQGKTNPASLTVGSDGTVEAHFYLQHDDSVVIQGLASGTKYTVVENYEDYKATQATTGDTVTAAADTSAKTLTVTGPTNGIGVDTTIAFTNERTGTIPTGVMMTVVPGVIIVAVAVGGLILLGKKKKTHE